MIILKKKKQTQLKNIIQNTFLYYDNKSITKEEHNKIIDFIFNNLNKIDYISTLTLTQIINLL